MKAYGGVDVQINVFLISAQVGGDWSGSRLGSFTSEEEPLVPIGYEAGWAPESVWMTWRGENSCP
jgi:hypothetical protein